MYRWYLSFSGGKLSLPGWFCLKCSQKYHQRKSTSIQLHQAAFFLLSSPDSSISSRVVRGRTLLTSDILNVENLYQTVKSSLLTSLSTSESYVLCCLAQATGLKRLRGPIFRVAEALRPEKANGLMEEKADEVWKGTDKAKQNNGSLCMNYADSSIV